MGEEAEEGVAEEEAAEEEAGSKEKDAVRVGLE